MNHNKRWKVVESICLTLLNDGIRTPDFFYSTLEKGKDAHFTMRLTLIKG